MSDTIFNCVKCGICCQHVCSPDIAAVDGVCVNYDSDTKLCKIYDTRPLICRVDEGYDAYFKDALSIEEYMKANYDACKKLIDKWNKPS